MGTYHDVEKGQQAFEDSPYDIGDLEIAVFHYHDDFGNDLYYTIYGPFDDYESFASVIEDLLDRYGVE